MMVKVDIKVAKFKIAVYNTLRAGGSMVDSYFDNKNNILINKLGITDKTKLKEAENYYFALGLKELCESKYFELSPDYVHDLHYILFHDVYRWAGDYREIDIERSELVLNGLSMKYSNFYDISDDIAVLFRKRRGIKATDLNRDEKIAFIADLIIELWLIHPFRDCNTRMIMAFINQYCIFASQSFNINLLQDNIDYFRRSLVQATFRDEVLEVEPNKARTYEIIRAACHDKRS